MTNDELTGVSHGVHLLLLRKDEAIARLEKELSEERARLEWLHDRLMGADVAVGDALGLPRGWVDLRQAINAARGAK